MRHLEQCLADYLAIRRALGYKLNRAGYLLPDFVAYLDSTGVPTITTEAALAWARQPHGASPSWWAQRLGLVRGFARYLQAIDPNVEIPPDDLLPRPYQRSAPHLYSQSDIAVLVGAARRLTPSFRAATYATLIGLLAVTGMRVGEALALTCPDIDWSNRLLIVRHSKFDKSREIPLHDSTIDRLLEYARLRGQQYPRSSSHHFFLRRGGNKLVYALVQRTFRGLVRAADLALPQGRRQPRLHDLRHSFAVQTLLNWYRGGCDMEAKLPLLSTYLGHSAPGATYWYLTAAPELLQLAGMRLQQSIGELP